MVRKIVGALVALGIFWGVGTWAGDGHPMPSSAWMDAVQDKAESLIDFSGDTVREKVPQDGVDLPAINELVPPQGDGAASGGGQ
ncbi:MAG: hypothetical protein L0H59_10945 [Tomitella sp.]|nr:hypothetical protein [Tomitella sp.]